MFLLLLLSVLLINTSGANIVHSKVLVALGSRSGHSETLADVEIIDLLSSETTCKKLENFPYANSYASGGLGFQDKPLICGGQESGSACHIYEDGVWNVSTSLKQERFGFAMTKSPFQDGSKLFLTGGYGKTSSSSSSSSGEDDRSVSSSSSSEVDDISLIFLSSSEVLTENGWQESVPLPVKINDHCMVTVNSTSVMVIGGEQNSETSGRSFLFNSETNIWTEGPTLNTARSQHSCGSIRKNGQTQDKSLIAVGGFDVGVNSLSSVEVLDLDSNMWRRGPDLPFGINGAMVEDPSGGVVLIGGYDGNGYLDTLYRLPHAGSDATWELMSQKLKTKKYKHTAFLIPDDISACN